MYDTQELDREIYQARLHMAKIHNGAYFNARIAELARLYEPMCSNAMERGLLRAKLYSSVDDRRNFQQATAVRDTINRLLNR